MSCGQVELLQVALLLVFLHLYEGAALAVDLEARALDGGQIACGGRGLDAGLVVVQVEVKGHVWAPLAAQLACLGVPAVGDAEPGYELVHAVAAVPVDDAVQAVVGPLVGHLEEGLAPVVVVGHDLVDPAKLAGLGDLACRQVVGVESTVLVALHRHALLGRERIELFGLGDGAHKGLVAHHVLAGQKRLLGERVVRRNRSADLHHVDSGVGEHGVEVGGVLHAGKIWPRAAQVTGVDGLDAKLLG